MIPNILKRNKSKEAPIQLKQQNEGTVSMNRQEEAAVAIARKAKRYGGVGLLALAAIVTVNASMFTVDGGQYAVEQTPGGDLVAHMSPGIKFKIPFFSSVHFYNEVTTVTYGENTSGIGTSKNKPFFVTFADTYGGSVKGSFRVVLPTDPDHLIALHRAFKYYDNFVANGIVKFTNELLSYTANQFTGESFMQGGQNEYKARLLDQARKGLYVTKRTQQKVKTQAGDAGPNAKASQTVDSEAVVYRNVIQRDAQGQPLRQENSMTQYGVEVAQVTIDGFNPQADLKAFMTNKKEMVRKRARLVEDQENERQQAITAKLKGDRERVEAKQKQLMDKDRAAIEMAKQVEMARLQADKETVEREKLARLAIIDKKKELQMATDEEAIQKARERAAKHEAEALKHKGLAEAEVEAAKLKAKQDNRDIVLAELHLQTVQALTSNLGQFTVEMPQYMSTGAGDGQQTNSLGVLLEAVGIQNLQQLAAPADKK